jgi:hypothetical protein
MVALSPLSHGRESPFLAIRWVGSTTGQVSGGGGIPRSLELHLLTRCPEYDQHDAYSAAAWLRRSDLDGSLNRFFSPKLPVHEKKVAEIEGWILGIA